LIRRLHAGERLPKAQIARQLGISRNTVAAAIASTDPPAYSRATMPTSFAPFEQQVRQLLDETPSIPATVLAERSAGRVRRRGSGRSLILTSNLPFARSGDVFGDQAVAAAMIDRIVHHAEVIILNGSSHRLRNTGIDTLPSARSENTPH